MNSPAPRPVTLESQPTRSISEILYRTVFETTGTATAVVGGDGIIIRVNGEWEMLHGYSKAEVQGKKNYLELFHQDEVERMGRYFRNRLIDPFSVPMVYETRIINKKSHTKHVLAIVNMIRGTSQRVISQVDITPLNRVKASSVPYLSD